MSSVHLPGEKSRLTVAVVIAVSSIFHFIADSLGFCKYAAFIRSRLLFVRYLCVYSVYHNCT